MTNTLPEPLVVQDGVCHALYTYDVGLGIDLGACDRRIPSLKQQERVKDKRRAPGSYFERESPPLRMTLEIPPVSIQGVSTRPAIDLVIHDFGAATVIFGFPIEGPLLKLLELSHLLYDNDVLRRASRQQVERLVDDIRPFISKPNVAEVVEDYCIFDIHSFTTPMTPGTFVSEFGHPIAQILRAETAKLSEQEIADALSCKLSFGEGDLAIVDWNAALLLDTDTDDVRTVLELANAELLEMRYLDEQLDAAMERSYEAMLLQRDHRWWGLTGGTKSDLRRIARLQVDHAVLFERINNALKLFGDQFLARIYRLASQRFHLNDWDSSILRKLQTLESIYQRLTDRAANRRMELLEWIIIILIAVSMVLPFVAGHK